MTTDARTRIDSHHLMRSKKDVESDLRIDSARNEIKSIEKIKKEKLKHRTKVHLIIFAISFVFTVGASVLGILLWVKPESFASIVFVGVFSSVVFVTCFAFLRMFILHKINFDVAVPENDEDLKTEHHLAKSIVYGFIALVFATLLMGLIVNIASANILNG